MNRLTISALATEDMTCLMMPEMVMMVPLFRMGLVDVVLEPR